METTKITVDESAKQDVRDLYREDEPKGALETTFQNIIECKTTKCSVINENGKYTAGYLDITDSIDKQHKLNLCISCNNIARAICLPCSLVRTNKALKNQAEEICDLIKVNISCDCEETIEGCGINKQKKWLVKSVLIAE